MQKKILRYGLISGALSSIMMVSTARLEKQIGFDRAEYLGYTLIVLSFLLVYFGIRSYRDQEGNGEITFSKGFLVGISITLITCLFYVVTWEILYFTVLHGFMDEYGAYMIQKAKASGASAAAIQTQLEQLAEYKKSYENPLYNSAVTFLEPFPVGLAVTLICALILRKKAKTPPLAESVTA